MKITPKIIEDVLTEVAGPEVMPLMKCIKNKKNVSENIIATALKKELNPTRNLLYRLYKENLVTYNRKKDKKKGWYIYYWTFNNKRLKFLSGYLKKNRIMRLKERLEREKNGNFYICKNKCVRLDFEQATDFLYKCPECGNLLETENNAMKIIEIQKEISVLEKELMKEMNN